MDYKEFENKEQERFLNRFYNFRDVKPLIPNITLDIHPSVKAQTKKGIQQGIDRYMNEKSSVQTFYLTDMAEFYYNRSIAEEIAKNLQHTHKDLLNIEIYSKDVNEAYITFIYQDSIDKFNEKFKFPKRKFT